MALFSSIKNWFFKKNIQNALTERSAKGRTFEDTRSIVMLYDASDAKTEKTIQNKRDVWVNGGKTMLLIGFDEAKTAKPLKTEHHIRLTLEAFAWDGALKKEALPILKKFDLLLLFNPKQKCELQLLATTIKADFKVGTLPESGLSHDLDLTLEMQPKPTAEDFFQDLTTYLNKIISTA